MNDRNDMHIMTINMMPKTPEDEKSMRAKLDRLGPEEVRSRLNRTIELDPNEAVPIDDTPPPWPRRKFVEDWLNEQRVAADRLQRSNRRWAIVAAVASIVAAILAAWSSNRNRNRPCNAAGPAASSMAGAISAAGNATG